jgi:hypothetical protein
MHSCSSQWFRYYSGSLPPSGSMSKMRALAPVYAFYYISLVSELQKRFPPPPSGATAPSGPGSPHYQGFTITRRYTTLGRTTLDE